MAERAPLTYQPLSFDLKFSIGGQLGAGIFGASFNGEFLIVKGGSASFDGNRRGYST